MPFTLPELPYAHDALAPYMSRETLEYHHDKHHKAYVDNGKYTNAKQQNRHALPILPRSVPLDQQLSPCFAG